jgi:hypothetical protein
MSIICLASPSEQMAHYLNILRATKRSRTEKEIAAARVLDIARDVDSYIEAHREPRPAGKFDMTPTWAATASMYVDSFLRRSRWNNEARRVAAEQLVDLGAKADYVAKANASS